MGKMLFGVIDRDGRPLTVSLGDGTLDISADAPVVSLRYSQLGAIGVDNGALEVAAVIDGSTRHFELALADPAAAEQLAETLLDVIRA